MSSSFVKHVPCPKCGSKDSGALYDDGHVFCFSTCQRIVVSSEDLPGDEVGYPLCTETTKSVKYKPMENILYKAIPERGITKETCEKYGVQVHPVTEYYLGKHVYPYYDAAGNGVGAKERTLKTKEFFFKGDSKAATLFGQHLFHAGGRYVTITEGELDALAAFQMTGSQWPVVSIKNGASGALKDCKASYDWLNTFENIVLAFDSDEPGKKAAKEVSELFGAKCKIVELKGGKDPCEFLMTGQTKQYVDAWWKAQPYKPEGIINGKDLYELLKQPQAKPDAHWPWKELDGMLGGLWKRSLVTVAAGTGQGKTTLLRQVIHHLLMTTDDNIGLAFLEESPQRTALGIMGIDAQKAFHIPGTEYTEQELEMAFQNTMGTGRCTVYNHFGSLHIDSVMSFLRWMVKVCGCSWIVLDHYQMILSGMDVDERKGLDMLLTKLRTFIEETGVGIIGVSHTRRIDGNKGLENGAEITLSSLRGTQGIAQLSDVVLGMRRDQQAEDPEERNTTELYSLKCRLTGETGPAGKLFYNKQTNRLHEVHAEAL